MKKIDLTQLTDEQLLIEVKKRKQGYDLFKVIIALMIGTAIFTTIKKGFGFFTLFPVFFVPIALSVKGQYDEAQKELHSRNL